MVTKHRIIDGAEPFFFHGGPVACILIHGFTGTPKEMLGLGEYLNKKGLTVLGVRLAGHATKPREIIRTRWQDWVASVEDGFFILRQNWEKVFLIGLSMGGILSLVCGSYLRVRGIAALATPFSLPDDWRLKFAKPLSIFQPWIEKGMPKTKETETNQEHIAYPNYPTRSVVELKELTTVLYQSFDQIKSPVLLINSRKDSTVPFDHGNKLENKLVNSARVNRVILESSSHVLTEGIEKDAVFESVYSFIEKHSN